MSAEQFLYLTTIGWKSGKAHEIEIWYVEYAGCCYIVAETRERAHWAQNIRHNSAISFRIAAGPQYKGTGRWVDPERDAALHKAVTALMDAKYEWSDGLIVELCPEA